MDESLQAIFMDVHSDLPREGPGSRDSTHRAFASISSYLNPERILDIGCGPGMQTLHLAEVTTATLVAVDLHEPYLQTLSANATAAGVSDRINTLVADMNSLPFEDETFDVIWSEGAAYIMGVANALDSWKRLLKPGGAIALTELTWLRPDPPDELSSFWESAYPDMKSVEGNQTLFAEAGLELIESFHLPVSDWYTDYYGPLAERIRDLRAQHPDDLLYAEVLDVELQEIALFEKYSEFYGYVFYIGRLNQADNQDVT